MEIDHLVLADVFLEENGHLFDEEALGLAFAGFGEMVAQAQEPSTPRSGAQNAFAPLPQQILEKIIICTVPAGTRKPRSVRDRLLTELQLKERFFLILTQLYACPGTWLGIAGHRSRSRSWYEL